MKGPALQQPLLLAAMLALVSLLLIATPATASGPDDALTVHAQSIRGPRSVQLVTPVAAAGTVPLAARASVEPALTLEPFSMVLMGTGLVLIGSFVRRRLGKKRV